MSSVTNMRVDIQSIFTEIGKKADVYDEAYFYHVIVIYARTDVLPYLNQSDRVQHMRNSPNFVLDMIFLHNTTDNVQVN